MASYADTVRTLAQRIAELRRLHESALAGEMAVLQKKYGVSACVEAAELLKNSPSSVWDADGHKRAVARGIANLRLRRAADPERFDIDPDSEI